MRSSLLGPHVEGGIGAVSEALDALQVLCGAQVAHGGSLLIYEICLNH